MALQIPTLLPSLDQLTTNHCSLNTAPISFGIRTYKKALHNSFQTRTYKFGVSKSFRIRTYKTGGRGVPCSGTDRADP